MNDLYLSNVWAEVVKYLSDHDQIRDESTLDLVANKCYILSLTDKDVTIVCSYFLALVIVQQSTDVLKDAFFTILHYPVNVIAIKEDDLGSKLNDKGHKTSKKHNFFKTKCDRAYTFENFVVGRSNIQSQVSALTCATNPGLAYNPLFIYGKSGLGKTHLLNAIGNKVTSLYPNYSIGFISGLDFVEGVSNSIKNHTIDEFKREFYDLDILLVDDIQFIAGKEKTHEVFFSVFNELVNNKRQICLTCDRLPQEIDGLEERIISRFNQGLNVNIEVPEYETSINILKKKLTLNTAQSIDDEVLAYIATNFSQDVRQLEGALNRLLFYAIDFVPTNHITIDIAKEAFKGQIAEGCSDELDVAKIKKVVCNYYGVTKQQLSSKIRTKNIAIPRQIAMYLSRKYLDMPYKDIGQNFGKRDHSTVISACEKVEENIRKDRFYQKAIQELEAMLK